MGTCNTTVSQSWVMWVQVQSKDSPLQHMLSTTANTYQLILIALYKACADRDVAATATVQAKHMALQGTLTVITQDCSKVWAWGMHSCPLRYYQCHFHQARDL
jgi:hypothetical protein